MLMDELLITDGLDWMSEGLLLQFCIASASQPTSLPAHNTHQLHPSPHSCRPTTPTSCISHVSTSREMYTLLVWVALSPVQSASAIFPCVLSKSRPIPSILCAPLIHCVYAGYRHGLCMQDTGMDCVCRIPAWTVCMQDTGMDTYQLTSWLRSGRARVWRPTIAAVFGEHVDRLTAEAQVMGWHVHLYVGVSQDACLCMVGIDAQAC